MASLLFPSLACSEFILHNKIKLPFRIIFHTGGKKKSQSFMIFLFSCNFFNDNLISLQHRKVENWSLFITIMCILLVLGNAETSLTEPNYRSSKPIFLLFAANKISYCTCLMSHCGYPRYKEVCSWLAWLAKPSIVGAG